MSSYSDQGWGQISGCKVKGSENGVAIEKLTKPDAEGNNVEKKVIIYPLSKVLTGKVANNILWE